MKLKTFLRATFGLALFSSCVAMSGLLYYVYSDHNAFVSDVKMPAPIATIVMPEMIIVSDPPLSSEQPQLISKQTTSSISSQSRQKKRELRCSEPIDLVQGAGKVRLCEFVDVE